jgi:hypothetical protein
VYFQGCAKSRNEAIDIFFECAVGEVGAEDLANVSDAWARAGCDRVAGCGAKDGCVTESGVNVRCEAACREHVEVAVDGVMVKGDEGLVHGVGARVERMGLVAGMEPLLNILST